jgi:hypothetical protein
VHAQLDTDTYPTGIQVSDEEIAALPITRHRFHGDWNYTVNPRPTLDPTPIEGKASAPRQAKPHLTTRSLQDPELTGMTRRQLSELTRALTPALAAQREITLRTHRGHERLVAPGTGAKARLTPADRILATVLHQRKLATTELLGQLFAVTAMTISRVTREVRPLLEAHGQHITASTARFRTPADIAAFLTPEAAQTKSQQAC